MRPQPYDPFRPGEFPVGVRTVSALDRSRDRLFPCEVWYPAAAKLNEPEIRDAPPVPGIHPLILFSHSSGGSRRQSSFLCTHLGSHGYIVAALDHSEVIAQELARKDGETREQKSARIEAWIENRVPDLRFLLQHLLGGGLPFRDAHVDPKRIGIAGHSFGGWTALAAPESEESIHAVVALAPAGSSSPKPGMIAAKLTFHWGRDVPTLYLVAENDISLPLASMFELFDRTPGTKQMVVLRHADHLHFMDDVEKRHEAVRATRFEGELAWIPKEMRPMAELCSGHQAHLFTRGLTLAHFDAALRGNGEARQFLASDLEAELAAHGIDAGAQRGL